jgi:hypothetical protein
MERAIDPTTKARKASTIGPENGCELRLPGMDNCRRIAGAF